MKILIIEDDTILMQKLKKSLEAQTFAVDEADDGQKGSYLARVNDYDLIITSDKLKEKSGLEVCKELRNANKTTPIIVISSTSNVKEKVCHFKEGADDHLVKPFSFDELLARIQTILRRPTIRFKPVLEVDILKLDCNSQLVTRGEKRIYLTRKEFALLEYLMINKGSVVSRGMIMEHVWNDETDPFSNTIESHILNLRRKIETKRKRLIHNVPGRGYKIDVEK